jgi:hypothetical protein
MGFKWTKTLEKMMILPEVIAIPMAQTWISARSNFLSLVGLLAVHLELLFVSRIR